MRPIDSAYDRNCAEIRSADPGAARYALISDHGGPCTVVRDLASLSEAIEAARSMDTDSAPTELEDELDVCADGMSVAWLIEQAEALGWRCVASAPAGEYWTVLVEDVEVEWDAAQLADILDAAGAWDWSDGSEHDPSDRLAVIESGGAWRCVYRGTEPDEVWCFRTQEEAIAQLGTIRDSITGADR